jgi:F-type H+-transporting ATPase subunit b|tara:strand:+ start:1166 stop:1663 length:498 start_codon:yes stop_codon:yes gene_type:complete
MTIDATFWTAISFLIFIILLIYLKIPQKITVTLNESIKNIKDQIISAENLKEEAKNILSEHDKKLGNSKLEIKKMLDETNEEIEKNILKTNNDLHLLIENRKKNAEEKINQMKDQAYKDIKNISVNIAIESVERLLKNSLDKNKLDKLYLSSIEETKLALKKKSS